MSPPSPPSNGSTPHSRKSTIVSTADASHEGLIFSDLDDRPEMAPAVVNLLAQAGPGRQHAVCGDPAGMGLAPDIPMLLDTPGVLIALQQDSVRGVLACCHYSDEQITLWGPVTQPSEDAECADQLLSYLRQLLQGSPFTSLRVQVDHRNRWLRAFYLRHGLSPWKDNAVFATDLHGQYTLDPAVRRFDYTDLEAASELLYMAFPESGHFERSLMERECEGYRHYGLWRGNALLGAAAVRPQSGRSWISMIAVAEGLRGQGIGQRLVAGIVIGKDFEAQC